MSVEIDPLERMYDLVRELLEDGERPRDILSTARDAIEEWRLERKTARNDKETE